MAKYRYRGAYSATVTLPDGTAVVVKPGQAVELGKTPAGRCWTPAGQHTDDAVKPPRSRKTKKDAARDETGRSDGADGPTGGQDTASE